MSTLNEFRLNIYTCEHFALRLSSFRFSAQTLSVFIMFRFHCCFFVVGRFFGTHLCENGVRSKRASFC